MKINTSRYEYDRKKTTLSSDLPHTSIAVAKSKKSISDTIELARQHFSSSKTKKKFNRMSTPDLESGIEIKAARSITKGRRASVNLSIDSRRQSMAAPRKQLASMSTRTLGEFEREKITL